MDENGGIIKFSDGKKYLYDIMNIKKDTFTSDWLTNKVTSATAYAEAQKENVFIKSISATNQNVNEKFSERDYDMLPASSEVGNFFSLKGSGAFFLDY